MKKPIYPERICKVVMIESDVHHMFDGPVAEVISRLTAYDEPGTILQVDYYNSCNEINIVREEWESREDYAARLRQYEKDLEAYNREKAMKQIERAQKVLDLYKA